MTFKHKSPGSDETTWDEAIVGVKDHTHYSNTMSKYLTLHLHMLQTEDKSVKKCQLFINCPPPPQI